MGHSQGTAEDASICCSLPPLLLLLSSLPIGLPINGAASLGKAERLVDAAEWVGCRSEPMLCCRSCLIVTHCLYQPADLHQQSKHQAKWRVTFVFLVPSA